jgi:hypothetical protein
MTKAEAIALFGHSQADLARALNVTRAAIFYWPDGELDAARADRVIGAALRLGIPLPGKYRKRANSARARRALHVNGGTP